MRERLYICITWAIQALLVFSISVSILEASGAEGPEASLSAPEGVKFEVVDVYQLTPEEGIRRGPGDVIGLDLAVRFRISTSDRPFSILVPADPVVLHPLGYSLVYEDDRPIWLTYSAQDGKSTKSPGMDLLPISGRATVWLLIRPHSEFEWEEVTATSSTIRAVTVFMKPAPSGQVLEVVSPKY